MAMVSGHVAAPVTAVWAELADGWDYSSWVVGTIKIREVDQAWPAVGSKLHHAVGAWPVQLQDESEVTESVPEQKLVLRARGWPVGEATVDIRLQAVGSGTQVEMREAPVAGPGAWIHNPLLDRVGKLRLEEMLTRFTKLVEGRQKAGTRVG